MDIVFYLKELIAFVLLTIWLVLLPGYFVSKVLKLTLTKIEQLTVSLGMGVSGFTLILYIFGSLGVRSVAYVILSIASFITSFWLQPERRSARELVQNRLWMHSLRSFTRMTKSKFVSLLVILFGTVILGSLMFRSGWLQGGELSFTEYRDSFWHLGLMEELVRQIPPLHPGFAPLPLTNYHYFAHLFGAGFLSLNVFNSLDFYFRLFPFFLTFVYGLSLYIVGRTLTKTTFGANLAVLFGYFTGSFAYVLPLFIKYPGFSWHESSFWLSQPFSMVINPSFALSAGLFLIATFLIIKILEEPKWQWSIPLIIISGTLISFKVYAGILVLGGLLVCGIWNFLKTRSLLLIIGAVLATILALCLFIPVNGKDAGNFMVFLPGWFLRSMVESPDRVQIIDWILRENTYAEAGNIWAILRYRFAELIIYLVGNLGIRILGLAAVLSMLKKLLHMTVIELFLLTTATFGLVVPLLFVQDGSIANTVQFSYYSLIIFSLWLAIVVNNLLIKKRTVIKLTLLGILFLLAIPTSLKSWYEGVVKPSAMGIDQSQLAAFNYLARNTKTDDIILVPGTYAYTGSLMAGTLSNRRLYYSDRLMAENTHKDFKTRETNLEKFYNSMDTGWNTSFLKDNKINYVYVEKTAIPSFNVKYYPLKKVFGNKIIDIYQVI